MCFIDHYENIYSKERAVSWGLLMIVIPVTFYLIVLVGLFYWDLST